MRSRRRIDVVYTLSMWLTLALLLIATLLVCIRLQARADLYRACRREQPISKCMLCFAEPALCWRFP
jgi:hypothetical protein